MKTSKQLKEKEVQFTFHIYLLDNRNNIHRYIFLEKKDDLWGTRYVDIAEMFSLLGKTIAN